MRLTPFIIYIFLGNLAIAQPPDLARAIRLQLNKSCMTAGTYTKEVTNLDDPAATPEKVTNSFPGDTTGCSLRNDLSYASEIYAWDPKQVEFFTQTQNGDTLVSRINPQKPGASDLKTQKIVYKDGKILYLESIIEKDYWLYESKVRIKVYFDAQGRYQSHILRVHTQVILIGDQLNMVLNGNATY